MREELAALMHKQWTGWMKHLFSKCPQQNGGAFIPPWALERWLRQMETPYDELSEEEKDSDRKVADKVLAVLGEKPAYEGGGVFFEGEWSGFTTEL